MRLQPSEAAVAVSQQLPQSHDNDSHQVNPFQCLIVSNNPEHNELLHRAAIAAQWETMLHSTASAATIYFEKQLIPFVVVDIDPMNRDSTELASIRSFAEQVSRSQALLTICGTPNDATEETWARKLGSWVYVPGIDHETDLNTLCIEALKVVKKTANRPQKNEQKQPHRVNRKKSNRALYS